MTSIENLINLVRTYRNVLNHEQFINPLVEQSVIDQLKEHRDLFTTTAKELKSVLNHVLFEKRVIEKNGTQIKTIIKKYYQNDEKHFYLIDVFLKQKSKHDIFTDKLLEVAIIQPHELTDEILKSGEFNISLLPILLNTNFHYAELIYSACWDIVEQNILNNLQIKTN